MPDVPITGYGKPDIKILTSWTHSDKQDWIHILAYDNEAELAERVFPVLEGFFRYSFEDWLRVLYLRDEICKQPMTLFTASFHFLFGSSSLGNTMHSFLKLWQKVSYLHRWM